jgi:hypothetical protein
MEDGFGRDEEADQFVQRPSMVSNTGGDDRRRAEARVEAAHVFAGNTTTAPDLRNGSSR